MISVPVRYNSIVYGADVPDPAARRLHGWQHRKDVLVMNFNRSGSCLLLMGYPPPWSFRMWMESSIACGRNGNGRVGGDYWHIGAEILGEGQRGWGVIGGSGGSLFGRYLHSHADGHQYPIPYSHCYTHPDADHHPHANPNADSHIYPFAYRSSDHARIRECAPGGRNLPDPAVAPDLAHRLGPAEEGKEKAETISHSCGSASSHRPLSGERPHPGRPASLRPETRRRHHRAGAGK